MEHTHIVQASDLSRYADRRDSEGVIPELVYHLVRQSVPNATDCRIPYGDAINQPGMDGFVECSAGYPPFIPEGISYWEIGTGRNPQRKAAADFKKRTSEFSDEERAASSFIFVTPRSGGASGWEEPEQRKWKKSRENQGWNRVIVIDGVKLADWLREFPAIGLWMAKKVGITPSLGGIATPRAHWDLIRSQGNRDDPPLPPELFTVSRRAACEALEAVFTDHSPRLLLFSESEHDVKDFIAAYLSTIESDKADQFANRCLFIDNEDAWRSFSELRESHVLVANPRLGLDSEGQDLQTVATRNGHSVIIPLCGAMSGGSPSIIRLRSPSASEIEAVLMKAGFPYLRARKLGVIEGGGISALRRYLLGLGSSPPYAKWSIARELAQAGLVGQWDAKIPADVSSMEILLGKDYGDWIEILRNDALRLDSPLIQTAERWRFVPRSEGWNALGNRIFDEDLDRLQTTAISVLGEQDPQFDLPKEDRFAATIHGKGLKHSQLIRKGLTETLALLGSRPKALGSCSPRKAETTAILVVRSLLSKASWERWASLSPHLPLLAEAAPDEFLRAVESAPVALPNSPFHEFFAQEGVGGLGGTTYMSGLLWALEGLAWNPDYLPRVSMILAELASIDPGGNWSNRPANSLASIFLPWHVQTTASFDKRKVVIRAILKEQPEVGWSLLLRLLPRSRDTTVGCHHPFWREFIPENWKAGVTQAEHQEQITDLTELAVQLAKEDTVKLAELVDRISDLHGFARENILKHLSSEAVVGLSESARLPIWEKLYTLVRDHRRFSGADWVLPEETITKIEEAANSVAPSSPEFKYRYLFSDKAFDLLDGKGDYEGQKKRLDEARQEAVSEILGDGNLDAVLKFATKVAAPNEVGFALEVIASDELEDTILPSLLDSEDAALVRFFAQFIWSRFWKRKTDWVDAVLARDWTPEHRTKFLVALPFHEEIWERVSSNLHGKHEYLYWRKTRVNPYGPALDLTIAIEKLLKYERAGAAAMCAARMARDQPRFDESLATRALLAVLENGPGNDELDGYQTVELIKRLQESETTNQDALFRIEWAFLDWVDRFSSGSPITLEKRLASDPDFFAEVINLVFRSDNASKEGNEEISDQRRGLWTNAYKLLTESERCPGTQNDGSFNTKAFNEWISEVRRITEESGHAKVAQNQIGQILSYAPPDPDGLWIHEAIAETLNLQDTEGMRSGFAIGLRNQRGAYELTHGQEERRLAGQNREKAEALDSKGYFQFAKTMREVAGYYNREAERYENFDPFGDEYLV